MPGIDGSIMQKNQGTCGLSDFVSYGKNGGKKSGERTLLGADDYISKPFGVMELRARINARLRREHREHSGLDGFGEGLYSNISKETIG